MPENIEIIEAKIHARLEAVESDLSGLRRQFTAHVSASKASGATQVLDGNTGAPLSDEQAAGDGTLPHVDLGITADEAMAKALDGTEAPEGTPDA